MAWVIRFGVPIDADRWARAFDQVVASSDVLRTRIEPGERERAQIASDPTSPTERVQLAADAVDDWATGLAGQVLDLAQSVYKSVLAEHPDGSTTWFLNIHHVATDAATSKLVVERTAAAYLGTAPETSRFYPWVEERARDDSAPREKQRAYWLGRPAAERVGRVYRESDRTDFRATRSPLAVTSERAASISTALETSYRLLSPDLSWAGLLVASAAIYVHRLSGATNFSIGLPIHHRNLPGAAGLLGPTMAVYPLDVHIEPDDTHASLHRRLSRQMLTVLGNADPALQAPGDYDVVVNVIPTAAPVTSSELPLTATWVHPGGIDPEHVMRIQATDYGDQADIANVHLELDLLDQVADDEQRRRAPQHLLQVLGALVDAPEDSIYASPLCTDNELDQIVAAERGPALGGLTPRVGERLRATLQGNTHTVIETPDETLTGDELWQWVVRLAGELDASEPAGARIGIQLMPSTEALVAIYACVLAGRPFVPLDPDQPASRLAALARRADLVRTFQTPAEVQRHRPARGDEQVVLTLDPPDSPDPTAEAYLLFTSGSTGQPKGVPITHQGLDDYLDFAITSYFDDEAAPVAPLFTALTFDLTITTLFAPVLAGGRLTMVSGSGPTALTEIATKTTINWIKATPSHLEILASIMAPGHQLATCVVGGEAFRSDLASRLLDANPAMALFNEYGPTEAVVGCMIYRVNPLTTSDHAAVPIGTPAPGVELRVVDPGGTRVPLGTAGELLISHRGVTAGYLAENGENGDPEQRGRDPFVEIDGRRFYRSGDLVVRNPDFGLTYLGRTDEQIKVGGVRLDPAEVEGALMQHPAIVAAAVRHWTPARAGAVQHCTRCGLPSDVPNASYDSDGVCTMCHAYDQVAPMAESWFGNEHDLTERLRHLTAAGQGDFDCIHLLSGGKDSTYALYRLVQLGLRPYAVTLDNGFISEGALENCRRVTEHLGIEYEVLTTPHMNAIFRDSLVTHSDVCHGCYKTIYTLATNKAVELGIPAIVTGLSRGQLFETRLIPGQFQQDRFDPDAIDRAVVEARKRYHRVPDVPNRLLDTSVFDSDEIFASLEYIDIYRYLDVELSEVLRFLAEETPWRRPVDTGRSSNCLINIAGIHAHQVEQGYHNYAEPYAWDVRLGHKQRDESMAELDDPIDPVEISSLLKQIGYAPAAKQLLTAWYQVGTSAERAPTPTELRAFLNDRLPIHSIPAAFVQVDELATTGNGKLDVPSLPAPDRQHRAAVGAYLAPESELERTIISRWEGVLGISPISAGDDFFGLGGDSLAAVTMIIDLGEELDLVLREELAFVHTSPRQLASAIEASPSLSQSPNRTTTTPKRRRAHDEPPALSAGELSVLFHQRARPHDVMYNVGRTFTVAGNIDHQRMHDAVLAAVERHEPLTWTYGSPRQKLAPEAAVVFSTGTASIAVDTLAETLANWQRQPFDLEHGPRVRCRLQPLDNGSTTVALAIHHVSGDHGSLDQLWKDIDAAYQGQPLAALPVGYADFCSWQRDSDDHHQTFWDAQGPFTPRPAFATRPPEPDGYVTKHACVSSDELRATAGRTPVANVVAAAGAAVAPFFAGHQAEVNLVASTRDHDLACDLVGYLLNPVPVVLDRSPGTSIAQMASDASTAIGQALPHRAFPFASIVTNARQRGVNEPSGSVLVSYSDDPVASLAGVPVEQRMLFNGHAVADLSFFVEPRASHVDLGLEYNGRLIDEATARRILDSFDLALHAAASNSDMLIGDLPAPPPSILHGAELADQELLVTKLLRNISATPDAVAIEVGTSSLTWKQLGARATQLAVELQRLGVGKGDRVAVGLDRSIELPIAIVGVMLAGASYVPVDPSYPTARISETLKLSAASVLIATADTPVRISIDTRLTVTADRCGDTLWNDSEPVRSLHDPDGAAEAYVIFTSGSTGQANGVAISQGQLAASTNARSQFYTEGPSRFLMLSSIAFDSSIVGLFWSMASGGTLILPTENIVHDIDRLGEYLSQASLSHVLCVPTLYGALLDRADPSTAWPEHVIVAGEACTPQLVAQHFDAAPTTRLTNEYGPTEASVWATAHHCSAADDLAVPIGMPIAGTWLAVVDEAGHVVPSGLIGELVLGGPNIARGYITLDSPKFGVATDFESLSAGCAGRTFATGDRAAIVDGQVLFVGRADSQLNVGGARVEPTEIEHTLMAIEGVSAAVVVAADVRPMSALLAEASDHQAASAMRAAADAADPQSALRAALSEHGQPDTRLVAHLVADDSVTEGRLRKAVGQLPSTHRPAIYQTHEKLALLPNGKVDRAAAQNLELRAEPTLTPTEPSGSHQDTAIDLFRRVLHTDRVGPHDSFFDLGGDSLRALELLRLVEAETQIRLATSTLHESPTPTGFARALAAAAQHAPLGPTDNTIVMPIQPEGTQTPIFALHNLGPNGSMWRPMAGYLGDDHPIYGIADPFALLDPFGDNYNLEHRPEIRETAARYVQHIEQIAPTGPVVLLGFCLGGVFGYEVAQQLAVAGRDVQNFIIVLDWHAPHLEYQENWVTLTKLSYRRSGKSIGAYLAGVMQRRAFLKSARRRVEGYAVKMAQKLRMPLRGRLQTRHYVEEGIHRIHSYVYEPYDGRITVIRSTEDPRIPTNLGSAGWGDLVSELRVEYVPGVGEKMLYEPHVERATEVVRQALM